MRAKSASPIGRDASRPTTSAPSASESGRIIGDTAAPASLVRLRDSQGTLLQRSGVRPRIVVVKCLGNRVIAQEKQEPNGRPKTVPPATVCTGRRCTLP